MCAEHNTGHGLRAWECGVAVAVTKRSLSPATVVVMLLYGRSETTGHRRPDSEFKLASAASPGSHKFCSWFRPGHPVIEPICNFCPKVALWSILRQGCLMSYFGFNAWISTIWVCAALLYSTVSSSKMSLVLVTTKPISRTMKSSFQ